MSPADIVAAAITVGVRVERVVQIHGGEPELLELFRLGGQYEGNTQVIAGLDSDGVEWRIAVVPGRGVPVIAPTTAGGQPTEQARFARLDDARDYAVHFRATRRWLKSQDVRIGEPVVEYAGPTR